MTNLYNKKRGTKGRFCSSENLKKIGSFLRTLLIDVVALLIVHSMIE
jgi:hypothetical protein